MGAVADAVAVDDMVGSRWIGGGCGGRRRRRDGRIGQDDRRAGHDYVGHLDAAAAVGDLVVAVVVCVGLLLVRSWHLGAGTSRRWLVEWARWANQQVEALALAVGES